MLFFDGQNILPKSGSALEFKQVHIAFLDNAFWSFAGNEIYRTTPGKSRELMFSLTPGTEILRIGVSGRYVWVSDTANFYTYHIESGDFSSYSLMELYQYNQLLLGLVLPTMYKLHCQLIYIFLKINKFVKKNYQHKLNCS